MLYSMDLRKHQLYCLLDYLKLEKGNTIVVCLFFD